VAARIRQSLRGKDVVVICDADPPGVAHGKQVTTSLLGIAASVKLIEGLPQSKDLTEWAERGGTREYLDHLITDAPALTPAAGQRVQSGLSLTRLGNLLREPEKTIPYLVDRMLPAGGLSLSVGKPKSGKSTR
jgi:hypothetical protein